MSRNYATFATSIWRPGDHFGALTDNAQRVYFMLATQSDISAAGVLSLNVRRWAGRSADGSKEKVIAGLQELASQRFIAYDYDSEELLIRTFVKWDGGYGNRKRKPVIERAVREVESPVLRKILAEELAKVGLPVEWVSGGTSDAHRMAYPLDGDEPPQDGVQEASDSAFSQVDSLSDGLSGAASDSTYRFDGVVVTQALVVVPQPSTRIPQPVPPPADHADARQQTALPGMPAEDAVAETDDQRAWRLSRAWHAECPGRNIPVVQRGKGDLAMKLKNLLVGYLIAKYTEDEITEALRRCDKAIPAGNHLEGALKDIRRETDPNQQPRGAGELARRGAPAQARRSTSTVRAEQALSIAEELDRENGHGRFATEGTR